MMGNRRVKLAPSILSADFGRLGEQVADVTRAGADYIHVDVMDGHFVPNITIGAPVVAAIRSWTHLPLDVHLMIERPELHIAEFVKSGANIITVHVEACPHLYRVIEMVKDLGARAGVSLNPGTPLEFLREVLPLVDVVLVMTVNPGFGGQNMIKGMIGKVAKLRKWLDEDGFTAELEVDGGINVDTASEVVNAGADVLVAGAAIFCSKKGAASALLEIKKAIGLTS
jgi:ribulose-phosphate 3-epimerase